MKLTFKFAVLFSFWQVSYVCALLLLSNYHRPGGYLDWTAPISLPFLCDGLVNLTLKDVVNHMLHPAGIRQHLFHCIISVLGLSTFYMARRRHPKRGFIIFATTSVLMLFAGGAMGSLDILLAFIFRSMPDGEWLGEGWPYMDVRAIWMLSCIYLSWEFCRRSRKGIETQEENAEQPHARKFAGAGAHDT